MGVVLQIDRNDNIRPHRTGEGNRHRIDHTAIHQPVAIVRNRRHQARHTAGGSHGKMDITFGEPYFPAGTEIGCHSAKRHLAEIEII
ncbi:hypothetical protein D3C76_1560560 [compost metagenome]